MNIQSRLHLPDAPRHGLTLIPVLVCLVLISIFMGMLAQRQVRGHSAAKMAVRKAQALQVLLGERDRITALKLAGKPVVARRLVLTRAEIANLPEPVAIATELAKPPQTGFQITVQIPADATTNFVREALNVP